MKTLHTVINLRGQREQAFKFAMGWKGGMKQCYTMGCEIYCPIFFNLKGIDLDAAILHDMVFNGEIKPLQ